MTMRPVILCLFLTMAGSSAAHDLWIEPGDGGYVLYQGHRQSDHDHGAHGHSSHHHGPELVPYAEGFVQRAVCASADGTTRELTPADGYPVRFDGPCAALAVVASSGVWTKTVHGTKNAPPEGLTGVVRSWRSVDTVKRIEPGAGMADRPLTGGLELVLVNDPAGLEVGDKLRLQAVYGGRPRPGVTLAYHGDPRGVTDAEGRVNVRVRHPGLQLLSGSFEEPGEPVTVHATVLQLEVPAEGTR